MNLSKQNQNIKTGEKIKSKVPEKERLRFYELLKRHISRQCRSHTEYERRMQRIIKALEV